MKIYNNYINMMNEKRKRTKEGPQTQIIAPKPFMDCLYKECTMTYKGIVETRTAGRGSGQQQKTEHFDVKFNGIIFPQPIRRICNLSRTILNNTNNHELVESLSVTLKSDTNSHPFSHKQILKQIVMERPRNNEDNAQFQIRID